jgi:hypothetical protein
MKLITDFSEGAREEERLSSPESGSHPGAVTS